MSSEIKNIMKKLGIPVYVLCGLAAIGFISLFYIEANPNKWIEFFGGFHPVFLHLPIGAVLIAVSMEVGKIVTKKKWNPDTTWVVFFAAATTIPAIVFGYALFWASGGSDAGLLGDHKRNGTIFGVMMMITFALKYRADLTGSALLEKAYLGLFFASSAVMGLASHQGGEKAHGSLFAPLQSREGKGDTPSETPKIESPDPLVYEEVIVPIFEAKCYSCHNDEKKKGGLRMHTWDDLMKGGDSGEVLIAGNVEKSFLIETLNLPMDDDLHMPPPKKKQLTDEEKQLITWWVEVGLPKGKRISELKPSAEITAALATLTGAVAGSDEHVDDPGGGHEHDPVAVAKKREELKATVAEVNGLYPNSIRYESQVSAELVFTSVNLRGKFTNEQLKPLLPISDAVVSLDLAASKINDDVATDLASFSNLKKLKLNETSIGDSVLKSVAVMSKLESLNLYGTQVTDAGLEHLASIKSLRRIYIWQTKVTKEGIEKFKKANPECEVIDGQG